MPHDKVQARLRAEYRRNSVTLLGGMEFRKDVWTDIPQHKVAEAKKNLVDYLDFQTLTEEEQGTAALQGTPTGYTPEPPISSEEEVETDPLEEPVTSDELDEPAEPEEDADILPKKPTRSRKASKKKTRKDME